MLYLLAFVVVLIYYWLRPDRASGQHAFEKMVRSTEMQIGILNRKIEMIDHWLHTNATTGRNDIGDLDFDGYYEDCEGVPCMKKALRQMSVNDRHQMILDRIGYDMKRTLLQTQLNRLLLK